MLTVFSENERLHAPRVTADAWLNLGPEGLSDRTRPVSFQGRITLLDFWDYSCINCLNTLPLIRKWHEQYCRYGLQVIGVHAPEFSFAQSLETVTRAVKNLGIGYPVGLDNGFTTWQAYANRAWPTQYVVDQDGYLKACNRGEGNAHALETLLRKELLTLNGTVSALPYVATVDDDAVPVSCNRLTPELYLGKARGHFGNVRDGQEASQRLEGFLPKEPLKPDTVYLCGGWQWEREYLQSQPENGISELNVNARAVRILAVMQAERPTKVWYSVDGNMTGWRWVHPAGCYPLVSPNRLEACRLRLWCDTPGLKLYTLLFQP